MSHLVAESRISVTELADHEGGAISSAWRWAQGGVRGAKLETLAIGGKRFTTCEAFARFVGTTTHAVTAAGSAPDASSTARRRNDVNPG